MYSPRLCVFAAVKAGSFSAFSVSLQLCLSHHSFLHETGSAARGESFRPFSEHVSSPECARGHPDALVYMGTFKSHFLHIPLFPTFTSPAYFVCLLLVLLLISNTSLLWLVRNFYCFLQMPAGKLPSPGNTPT